MEATPLEQGLRAYLIARYAPLLDTEERFGAVELAMVVEEGVRNTLPTLLESLPEEETPTSDQILAARKTALCREIEGMVAGARWAKRTRVVIRHGRALDPSPEIQAAAQRMIDCCGSMEDFRVAVNIDGLVRLIAQSVREAHKGRESSIGSEEEIH